MSFIPNQRSTALVLSLFISLPAMANSTADTPKEIASPWKANVEAGAVLTSGNTDSSSFNAASSVKYTTDGWLAEAKFSALNSREDKKTSKEKYNGRLSYNKNLTRLWYVGWVAQQERDRFSGYYHQSSSAISLGLKAINTPKHQLNFEAGPGYFFEKERDTDTTNKEYLNRLATNYAWQINTGVSLEQEYIVENSSEKTLQHYEAGLSTQLNSRLAAKLSYKLKKDSQVPANKAKTDTQTSLNLVYNL